MRRSFLPQVLIVAIVVGLVFHSWKLGLGLVIGYLVVDFVYDYMRWKFTGLMPTVSSPERDPNVSLAERMEAHYYMGMAAHYMTQVAGRVAGYTDSNGDYLRWGRANDLLGDLKFFKEAPGNPADLQCLEFLDQQFGRPEVVNPFETVLTRIH